MPNRAGERPGDRAARCGRCRRQDEANGCGRRFGLGGLPQQEHRSAGVLRSGVQPPCRGEVQPLRTAADFEDDGGKRRHPGGLLGDPQRIDKPWRRGKQQFLRFDAEAGMKPSGIGKAGLPEDLRGADPQDRQSRPLLEDEADERKRKAGDGPGIAGLRAMDLVQRRFRQAAAQGGIETLDASAQKRIWQRHSNAAPDKCDIGGDIRVKRRAGRSLQAFR